MAARCAVCGKGPQTGFTRLRVCVKCLKAGKVQRVAA